MFEVNINTDVYKRQNKYEVRLRKIKILKMRLLFETLSDRSGGCHSDNYSLNSSRQVTA